MIAGSSSAAGSPSQLVIASTAALIVSAIGSSTTPSRCSGCISVVASSSLVMRARRGGVTVRDRDVGAAQRRVGVDVRATAGGGWVGGGAAAIGLGSRPTATETVTMTAETVPARRLGGIAIRPSASRATCP